MPAATEPTELSLPQIAALTLKRARGDVQRATAAMHQRVMKNQKLYRQLMDPLVREACYSLVAEQCRVQRRAIWNPPQPTTDEGRATVHVLARATVATFSGLMGFPLHGGKPLGAATRSEILESAAFWIGQGQDMLLKGYWLVRVGRAIPADETRTAAAVLRESRLQDLKRQTERELAPMAEAAE